MIDHPLTLICIVTSLRIIETVTIKTGIIQVIVTVMIEVDLIIVITETKCLEDMKTTERTKNISHIQRKAFILIDNGEGITIKDKTFQ